MAQRCIAGEFDGSAVRAANEPECLRLGVARQTIQYHMDIIDQTATAARDAGRKRVATEAAAAEVSVQFVFVERAGSAPAAAAIVAALGAIETQIGGRLERVAKLARAEAATHLQAGGQR